MKKTLLISKLFLIFLLFTAWNVSAQDYYFLEGFAVNGTPDGWDVKDVSYSDGSHAANMVDTTALFSAKMKTNNLTSWIQMPKVNGVTDLSFWCKLRDPDQNPVVIIQSSTDGLEWTDVVTNPAGLDLTNIADFQFVTVPLNIDGEVTIRIYVSADGGTSSKGMLYVDDIALGKPAAATDDATLLSLMVGGNLIDGFDFNVTSYAMEVSHAMDYTVTAEANSPNATVVITQVSDITGSEAERTATVVVTAEDNTTIVTTTIIFTHTDYWYQDGFETSGLDGWERNGVFFDSTPTQVEPTPGVFPGVGALKFTRGHPTGNNPEPGFLLSPKIINVGTFSLWVAAEVVVPEHEFNIYTKTSDTDSTLLKSIKGADLTAEWQEVIVEINETTDSIQIKVEGVCDINDASDSRIWMDDFLVTYYEEPVIGADDATLSALYVGGTLVEGFDPAITSYALEISILVDPTVTAEPTNENATVVITQAIDAFGNSAERTATVEVTSADESVTSTTTIVFNPSLSISDFKSPAVSLYPNPVNSILNFNMPENIYQGIEVYNILGQKVMQETIKAGQKSINVEGLQNGIYVMSFTGKTGTYTAKFIKK